MESLMSNYFYSLEMLLFQSALYNSRHFWISSQTLKAVKALRDEDNQ